MLCVGGHGACEVWWKCNLFLVVCCWFNSRRSELLGILPQNEKNDNGVMWSCMVMVVGS